MRKAIPAFNPEGLDKYLNEEKAETNTRGKAVVETIEKMLQKVVLDELKREMPEGEDWWTLGVPKPIRIKVTQKYEEDDRQRGGYEFYFDLVDYQKIAMGQWNLFAHIMGDGSGGKEKQLSWINFVNSKRNIVSHASSGKALSVDDLHELESYETRLRDRIRQVGGSAEEAADPVE